MAHVRPASRLGHLVRRNSNTNARPATCIKTTITRITTITGPGTTDGTITDIINLPSPDNTTSEALGGTIRSPSDGGSLEYHADNETGTPLSEDGHKSEYSPVMSKGSSDGHASAHVHGVIGFPATPGISDAPAAEPVEFDDSEGEAAGFWASIAMKGSGRHFAESLLPDGASAIVTKKNRFLGQIIRFPDSSDQATRACDQSRHLVQSLIWMATRLPDKYNRRTSWVITVAESLKTWGRPPIYLVARDTTSALWCRALEGDEEFLECRYVDSLSRAGRSFRSRRVQFHDALSTTVIKPGKEKPEDFTTLFSRYEGNPPPLSRAMTRTVSLSHIVSEDREAAEYIAQTVDAALCRPAPTRGLGQSGEYAAPGLLAPPFKNYSDTEDGWYSCI